jgi:hypothetical protein
MQPRTLIACLLVASSLGLRDVQAKRTRFTENDLIQRFSQTDEPNYRDVVTVDSDGTASPWTRSWPHSQLRSTVNHRLPVTTQSMRLHAHDVHTVVGTILAGTSTAKWCRWRSACVMEA